MQRQSFTPDGRGARDGAQAGLFKSPGAETMTQVRFCRLAASAIAALLVFAPLPARAQDKIIKIGAWLPMSGPGSYFGAQDRQGSGLALDELKGGEAGYKVGLRYEDSPCAHLPWT